MSGRLEALALVYGEESRPDMFGDTVVFEPGSLYVTGPVTGLREHFAHDPAGAMGVAAPEDVTVHGDQVRIAARTIGTPAGALSDTELAAGARRDVSVGVLLDDWTTEATGERHPVFGWPVERTRVHSAELVEFSQTLAGRMPSARVVDYTPEGQDTP